MSEHNLDKQITIEIKSLLRDTCGQEVESWATCATCYAEIKPQIGKNYIAAKQINRENVPDITIRYRRNLVNPKAELRVVYLGRYLYVESILDPEEKREWLYIKCREDVA